MQKKLYLYLLPLLLATTPLVALTPTTKAKTEKKKKTKKFVAPDAEIKTLESSPFKDIAHEYMKGFAAPEEDEDDVQQNKLRTEIPQMSDHDLFTHIFNLYQTIELATLPVFNKNGWKDLELLCGDHQEHINLVHFLKRTKTKIGEGYLGFLFSYPIPDPIILKNRQAMIKEFISNKSLTKKVKAALDDIAATENNLFFFWQTESDYNLKAISSYFFTSNLPGIKKLKKGNTNPYVMEALCFKGRLISYSIPLIIPALYFGIHKSVYRHLEQSKAHEELKEKEQFKALEKKFEEIFTKATPEQRKAFLNELEAAYKEGRTKNLYLPTIQELLGERFYGSISINGTDYLFEDLVKKYGRYEAQNFINAEHAKQNPFAPTRQAKYIDEALNRSYDYYEEKTIIANAFTKAFGPLSKQCTPESLAHYFSQAKPEQKMLFLDSLEKEAKDLKEWSCSKQLLGAHAHDRSISSRTKVENGNGYHTTYTSESYENLVKKHGHYKAQEIYLNDTYETLPFAPKKQAELAAQSTFNFNTEERNLFFDVYKKVFGAIPQEYDALDKTWQQAQQEATRKSWPYATNELAQGCMPFRKKLRGVESLEEIKGFDAKNPENLLSQEAPHDYSLGDKWHFSSLKETFYKKDSKWGYAAGEKNLRDLSMYGTGFLYAVEALTIAYSYSRETSYNAITNYLHAQTMAVGTLVRAMQTISAEIKKNAVLRNGLEHHAQITALFNAKNKLVSKKMHQLVSLLLTNTFTGKPSYFCFKGRVLAAYALMKEIKNDLAPALLALGEIDAYLSCATLYQEYQGKPNGFCFADYVEQDAPYIRLTGMWNPFIPSEKAIANSIELGGTKPLNVILTGPNAGGKSTFSKGLTLNVLLAQTIGIVPGQELVITPFEKINTYMNITDDTAGGNSLFKSEVLRAQSLLKTIADLDKKKFSFSIMDEMFSGTSPREGEAAGYAVAKNLGANTNSIAVIATHFPKLKELEKTTGNFKNYQVRVAYAPDGSFTYPFKLEEGAADQNVAIAILQQQGFDSSILNDAQDLLKVTPSAAAA